MSILQAFVLGVVQGLTEFLPISSSGHLIVVPYVFGWDEPTLAFSVAVHLGTLIAVAVVFRPEIEVVVRTVTRWRDASDTDRYLVRLLAIGTVPAVIAGLALEPLFEDQLTRPMLVVLMLGVTGYFLVSTETKAERREEPARDGDHLQVRDAIGMGIAQAFAIVPGISRSGATIATGMRLGLSRSVATRFSFLLAIPAVAGAAVLQIPSMIDEGLSGSGPAFIVGVATSAASGIWAIRWFLDLVQRASLRRFGAYLGLLVAGGLLAGLARG